jgi:site-specific recombinase XerD
MTSTKLINEFAQYLKSKKKSDSTILAYTKDLSQLAESQEKDLTQFVAGDIREFITTLGLTPKTISRKINSFRTFYKYLIDNKKIDHNPAMEISHPKFQASKPRVLSPVEYLALRQVSSDNMRLYTMIELMLQTGIRIGEISRLKVADVDIKKTKGDLFIREFSTNPSRTVELNTKAIELLNNYLKTLSRKNKNSALFATRDGNHVIIRNIRSSIDRAIDKAGIKNACVNDLRNTFIVHQLEKGVPVEKITEVVGHKSKSTTTRYLELLDEPYKAKGSAKISEL